MTGPVTPPPAAPTRDSLARNSVSGAIAAVIFVVISLLTGGSAAFVIVGAILVFVIATAIAVAIGAVFDRRRAG